MTPAPVIVAALVEARRNSGRTIGRGAYEAWKAGFMELIDQGYELNLRGQDVADEAIALAAQAKPKKERRR